MSNNALKFPENLLKNAEGKNTALNTLAEVN
jgi:hypothetical protein